MIIFPDPNNANEDGLVALGGNLELETLLTAYQSGIFPWPMGEKIPLPWFSPDPRGVIKTNNFHVPKSLKRSLNKNYQVTFNQQFREVVHNCAFTLRKGEMGTWITHEIYQAYLNMFKAGYAYSVEVMENEKLIGGLYGVCIGELITGESMFSHKKDASKIAICHIIEKLKKAGITLFDTQILSPVVKLLGGEEISRQEFLHHIKSLKNDVSRDQILK